jgi:hypothetical protein
MYASLFPTLGHFIAPKQKPDKAGEVPRLVARWRSVRFDTKDAPKHRRFVFKQMADRHGIENGMSDAITGHAPASVGRCGFCAESTGMLSYGHSAFQNGLTNFKKMCTLLRRARRKGARSARRPGRRRHRRGLQGKAGGGQYAGAYCADLVGRELAIQATPGRRVFFSRPRANGATCGARKIFHTGANLWL